MNYFSKNLSYLLKLTGLKQKVFASKINVSDATVWKWKKGSIPKNVSSIQNLMKFFSEQLNIPLDLFENGQALLEKDFSQILADQERSLQSNDSVSEHKHGSTKNVLQSSIHNTLPDQKYTEKEQELFDLIRRYDSGDPHIEISPNALEILREFISATRLDLDYLKHQARAIRSWGYAYGSNKGGKKADSTNEKTDKK